MYNFKISKPELYLLIINCLIFKIFSSAPSFIFSGAGSGAPFAALLGGIIFIAVVYIAKKPLERLGGGRRGLPRPLYIILFAYFLCSSVYALFEFSRVIKTSGYPNTPIWFILLFIGVPALVAAVKGLKTIFRLSGLLIPLSLIGLIFILICSLGGDISGYNLLPVLGADKGATLRSALKSLLLYTDILVPIVLYSIDDRPEFAENIRFGGESEEKDDGRANRRSGKRRRGIHGFIFPALAAAAINFSVVLIFTLTFSAETMKNIEVPLYPLSKAVTFGKLFARLDALYLIAALLSCMSYISVSVCLTVKCAKKINLRAGAKPALAVTLAALSCLSLSSCYDDREIEETAFVVALGLDDTGDGIQYTFQFSNPLATGQNSGSRDGGDSENPTVISVTATASNIYEAMIEANNKLGKNPSLSHLKLIRFSTSAGSRSARLCGELLDIQDVRSDVKVCMAENAEEYLNGVRMDLEMSTARYYELLFSKNNPQIPSVNLRAFAERISSNASDAYLPVMDGEFCGIELFSGGVPVLFLNRSEASVFNILNGGAKDEYISADGFACLVSSDDADAEFSNGSVLLETDVELKILAAADGIGEEDIRAYIEEQANALLYKIKESGSDPFQLRLKSKTLSPIAGAQEFNFKEAGVYAHVNIK